jgi:hypothetical protein
MSAGESQVVFMNLKEAENLLENHPDPVVRAVLGLVYSSITWEIQEHDRKPGGVFDIGYCFRILSGSLTKENLERVLRDPTSMLSGGGYI